MALPCPDVHQEIHNVHCCHGVKGQARGVWSSGTWILRCPIQIPTARAEFFVPEPWCHGKLFSFLIAERDNREKKQTFKCLISLQGRFLLCGQGTPKMLLFLQVSVSRSLELRMKNNVTQELNSYVILLSLGVLLAGKQYFKFGSQNCCDDLRNKDMRLNKVNRKPEILLPRKSKIIPQRVTFVNWLNIKLKYRSFHKCPARANINDDL